MMNIEVGVRTLYWQSYAPPLGIAGLKMGLYLWCISTWINFLRSYSNHQALQLSKIESEVFEKLKCQGEVDTCLSLW